MDPGYYPAASDEVYPKNLDASLSALCRWNPLLLLIDCAETLLTQPPCFALLNFDLQQLHLHLHHHTREELHRLLDAIHIPFPSPPMSPASHYLKWSRHLLLLHYLFDKIPCQRNDCCSLMMTWLHFTCLPWGTCSTIARTCTFMLWPCFVYLTRD